MINRNKTTVLVLKDTYPGTSEAEYNYIEKVIKDAGYYVRYVSVEEFSGIANIYNLHSFALVVPACDNLPIETINALERYSAGAGSILFLGGPLYLNRIEKVNGKFTQIPLDNVLDASFTVPVPFVREGIAPSYKTYNAKYITKAVKSPDQNIYDGKLELPGAIDVTIPCETGISGGYVSDNQNRFISLVDSYDDNSDSDDIFKKGRCNGRRGAFSFMALQRTISDGYEGINDYGMVNCTAMGSCCAVIGARCSVSEIKGADVLIADILKRFDMGLYLFNGGLDGISYRRGERAKAGAQVLNTSERFVNARIKISVEHINGTLEFEEQRLISPKSISDFTFDIPDEIILNNIAYKDYNVKVSLEYNDTQIDSICSEYRIESPVATTDKNEFVSVCDDYFTLGGKPWYLAGINYWSTYNPALEKKYYWLGQFDRANYSQKNVENDLDYIEKIGLNCLMVRVDFTSIDRIIHGLRDFIERCRRHGIKLFIAFVKATSTKFYCSEAVEYIFSKVFIANNPTVMALDIEWESMNQHFLIEDTREEFFDEWHSWLINKYQSIENAEKYYGQSLERDIYGYVKYPPFGKKTSPDILRFTNDCINGYWDKMMLHLKPLIPNQLVTFRHGGHCTSGYSQARDYIDFTALEIYWFDGYEKELDDPEVQLKAMGLCVSGAMAQKYETGGKPVIWAEYGYSVCGIKWLPDGVRYDHENRCYWEEDVRHPTLYNRVMCQLMEDAHCAGSAPWWWCGGFRFTEMADFGYMMPNGVLSESGKEYAEFCARMKTKAGMPDTRETYICEGNVFDYPDGKAQFIKEYCVPQYVKAHKQGKRFEVITHYDAE